VREHLGEREHFSWIYAARLAAEREYGIMNTLYPKVSIPKPLDQNRHAILMEVAKGSLLSKTKLIDPQWYLDEILKQAKIVYSMGVIHADLSEYNIFVSENGVQLIDWPQYITLEHPHADEILERDISNILTHFYRKYGIKKDLNETISEIKNEAEISAEHTKEGSEGKNNGNNVDKRRLAIEEFEEEGFEDESLEEGFEESFEEEGAEAENFEAEIFEAEDFETEDLETENFETTTSKKEPSNKD
jgi:RIO kinase 2